MAATAKKPKLVAIVGPTASGKSALAMRMAQRYNGEIIAADSRTVYKDMDIGTAKPSTADQKAVSHWVLDLVKPGQRFTAYQFKNYATDKIADIQGRNKLPILVGGSGLYIDALIYDYKFDAPEAHDPANPRHRLKSGSKGLKNVPDSVLIIGLDPGTASLRQNINGRAEQILKSGVVQETQNLLQKYGKQRLQKTAGIIYKICLRVLSGEISEEQALDLFKTADWQYAKRQRTWFKRNANIKWYKDPASAQRAIDRALNK